MLSNCPDLQVVAEASDGLEAVRMGSGSPPMMVSEKAEAFTLRKQLLLFDSGVVLKLHHEGDAKFPSVLEHEIFQTERNQEGLEGGIERQTTLILHQTLKPLYDELYQKE